MPSLSTRWPKLPLLLSLLLLMPRLGWAAEDAPLTLAPAPHALPGHPRLLEEDFSSPERTPTPQGVRVLAELGGGLVASLGGSLAGGLLGLGLCETTGLFSGFLGCVVGASLGAVVGGTVGLPLGVWWVGDRLGGDGSLLATFGGMGAGFLAGALLLYSVRYDALALSPIVLGIAGSLIGYELSTRAQPPLQPLLSVSPQGAVFGVGGRF
jgi:hypothetical protein